MVACAPLLGGMLTKFGKKNVLMLGCLSESIAMFCFGLFYYIKDPTAYGILSFLCRIVEGFGNGCLNSSTSAIICQQYPDNMGNLIGLTQTFTGLGMLSGPIFGSFLYEAGGFKLPFFVTGALLLALNFPITCLFEQDHKRANDEDSEEEEVLHRRGRKDSMTSSVMRIPQPSNLSELGKKHTSFFALLSNFVSHSLPIMLQFREFYLALCAWLRR